MSTVLTNLAAFLGVVLFVATFTSGLVNGVSFGTLLFRSIIVLCLGTVAFTAFFRHFNVVLFKFLEQKLAERMAEEEVEPAGELEGEEE